MTIPRRLAAADIFVGQAVRDFLFSNLPTLATTFFTLLNDERDADEQIAVPAALTNERAYLFEPNAEPPVLPSVQSFVSTWRPENRNNRRRFFNIQVVLMTGLESPDKVAYLHGVLAEAIAQSLEKPAVLPLIDDHFDDFLVDEAVLQSTMSDELGADVGGRGTVEVQSSPFRVTIYDCIAIKEVPRA